MNSRALTRSFRPWRNVLYGALAGFALLVPPLFAQTNTAPVSPARYLLIVDMSLAMRPRAEAVRDLIGSLLVSGMNGQLRPGDTIGLWTFDDAVHAGNFPLQRWAPDARKIIATAAVEFLRGQPYRGQSRLDRALAQVQGVVRDSDRITVVILSDGGEPVNGTPFDSGIKDLYKVGLPAMQQALMPLATVLRAQRGEWIGYSVNMGRWPLQFPRIPSRTARGGNPEARSQSRAQTRIAAGGAVPDCDRQKAGAAFCRSTRNPTRRARSHAGGKSPAGADTVKLP